MAIPYITITDITNMVPEDEIIMLTDDESLGNVNSDRVDEAIAQADSEVNGYLAVRYSVPLGAPVPNIVAKLSTDIAIHNLYSRGVAESVPEVRRNRYLDAIKTLKEIAKGTIFLDVEPLPDSKELESGAESNKTEDESTFTRDNMEGF